MTLSHTRILISIPALALTMACLGSSGDDSSGSDDPGDACERLCDEIETCDPGITDDEACEDECDGVEALEDEVPAGCEDAITELFDCASRQSCDVLEFDSADADPEDPHYLDDVFDACEEELEAVYEECEGYLGDDDEDDE